jgi:hypothetical protein
MPLISLEEHNENHNLDPNNLHLLVAAGHLPHKRKLGRIYLDDQVPKKLEEEQRFWVRAWKKKRR